MVVLGTAGAFGYRAMFGGSFIPSLPPIITPGNTPIKILPQKDAQAAPGNQTTVPKGTGDQVVPHQETAGRSPGRQSTAARDHDDPGHV